MTLSQAPPLTGGPTRDKDWHQDLSVLPEVTGAARCGSRGAREREGEGSGGQAGGPRGTRRGPLLSAPKPRSLQRTGTPTSQIGMALGIPYLEKGLNQGMTRSGGEERGREGRD